MVQPLKKQAAEPQYTEALQRILQRAQEGDEEVLPQLQALLAEHPQLVEQFGDLAQHAEEALLNLVAGRSLLGKEALRCKLAELQEELGGTSAPPLEQLLISRIAISWLQVHHADLDAAVTQMNGQSTTPRSLHAHRRLDQAHRRYLASIKQLALVRKLLKPVPSLFTMAMRPVPETDEKGSRHTDRNTMVTEGVPVLN